MSGTRRRKKPAPAATNRASRLNEDEIIQAALRLSTRIGFDGLSMRALARELGATPMAIYYYVPDKHALQVLVADKVLESLPSIEYEGDWEATLRELALALLDMVHKHPGVAAFLIEEPTTPLMQVSAKQTIAFFRDAGFSEQGAILAYLTFSTSVFGLAAAETQRRRRESSDALLAVANSETIGPQEYLEFWITTIIAGLREQLRNEQQRSVGSSPARQTPRLLDGPAEVAADGT
jgi:AcrR family transcriptional regulator